MRYANVTGGLGSDIPETEREDAGSEPEPSRNRAGAEPEPTSLSLQSGADRAMSAGPADVGDGM